MGFFDEIADTFKVMKDIVHGGIESYKAGEKLDALIVRVEKNFGDALTADDKKLLAAYKTSKQAYDDNTDSDKNDSLPENLRDEITAAVAEFKQADNRALESAADTIGKYAENDEQRDQVRKAFEDSKRK